MRASAELIVEDVTKRFGRLAAMNNMYFKVNRPEILELIGPNEFGKTPVVRLISGVQRLA